MLEEALIPSLSEVKKKYRKGTLISRFFRHVFEHKSIKKVVGTGFAMVVLSTPLVPQIDSQVQEYEATSQVIQTQNSLVTQKSSQYPLDLIKINQGFGYFHPGVDLGGTTGNPIRPIKRGQVIYAGFSYDGYGNHIIVDHGNGITSLYAHLSKIEAKEGQEVNTNTEIGQLGRTGHTTGPHLHLEIRDHGRAINPLSVL